MIVEGQGTVAAGEMDVLGGVRTGVLSKLPMPVRQMTPLADPLGLSLPPAPTTTYPAVLYTKHAPLTLNPAPTWAASISTTAAP